MRNYIKKAMKHHLISLLIGICFCNCCFAQSMRILPYVSGTDTAYVYAAQSFMEIEEQVVLEPSTQTLTFQEFELVGNLLNSTTSQSRERSMISLDDGFFVEIRHGSNKPFGCFFNRKGYTPVPDGRNLFIRTYRYPPKQKEVFLALVEKYKRHSESRKPYLRLDSFPVNCTYVGSLTRCLFSGFRSCLYVDFYVSKDSLYAFPISYKIGYKQKKMVPTFISREYYPWEERPLSRIDQDGTLFFFNTQGEECSAKTFRHKSDEALRTLMALFPSWTQMTEQERMRMLDDYIINQSRKSDNNQ